MPEDTLRGTEPIRHIHAFLFLYSEVKHTENMYDKFRRFLRNQIAINANGYSDKKVTSDSIEIDDMVRDILNPKSGANVTVHKIYNLTFGKENMAMDILNVSN